MAILGLAADDHTFNSRATRRRATARCEFGTAATRDPDTAIVYIPVPAPDAWGAGVAPTEENPTARVHVAMAPASMVRLATNRPAVAIIIVCTGIGSCITAVARTNGVARTAGQHYRCQNYGNAQADAHGTPRVRSYGWTMRA